MWLPNKLSSSHLSGKLTFCLFVQSTITNNNKQATTMSSSSGLPIAGNNDNTTGGGASATLNSSKNKSDEDEEMSSSSLTAVQQEQEQQLTTSSRPSQQPALHLTSDEVNYLIFRYVSYALDNVTTFPFIYVHSFISLTIILLFVPLLVDLIT